MTVPSEIVNIVFDTSVVRRDMFFQGSLAVYLSAAERGIAQVFVPEIVIAEAVAQYRKALSDARNRTHVFISLGLSRGLRESLIKELDRWDQQYERWLRNTFTQHKVRILPYPSVGHDEIIRRMYGETRPFRNSDNKGYRDSLVWESVRALCDSESGTIYFLSGDTKDFAGEGDSLHPHLIADLKGASHSPARITLEKDPKELADRLIRPHLPDTGEPAVRLRRILTDFTSPEFQSLWALARPAIEGTVYPRRRADPRCRVRVTGPVMPKKNTIEVYHLRDLNSTQIEITGELIVDARFLVYVLDEALQKKREHATGCTVLPVLYRTTAEQLRSSGFRELRDADPDDWWTNRLQGHACVDYVAVYDSETNQCVGVDARISSATIDRMESFIS